jgi:cell division protein FtsL
MNSQEKNMQGLKQKNCKLTGTEKIFILNFILIQSILIFITNKFSKNYQDYENSHTQSGEIEV